MWISVTVLAWSITYPLIKLALNYMGPFVLLEIRLLIGGAILLAVSRGISWGRKQFISALLNVALFLVLLNLGIEYSSNPALSAVLIYTQPAFLVVIGLVLGERVSALQASGTALAVLGALVSAGSVNFDLGSLLSLMGGLVWALGTVYHRRNLLGEDLLKLNAFYSLVSAVIDSPLLLVDHRIDLTVPGITYAMLVAVLAQAVGFVFWFKGIKDLGPYIASNTSLLVPVLAYVFSFLILGRVPNLVQVVGSAMIILGVLLTNISAGLRVEREVRNRDGSEEDNSGNSVEPRPRG